MDLILIFSVFNLVLFLRLNHLSRYINIYDKPDKKRKFHKKIASVTGGTIFYVNYLLFLLAVYFLDTETQIIKLETKIDFFTWFVFPSLVFFIGLYDDKKNIKGTLKFVLILIISFFFNNY